MSDIFKQIGLLIPEILLPSEDINKTKWSVIACDQYTSNTKYWEETISYVSDAPSTLKLTLPEIFLESEKEQKKISDIHSSMHEYITNSILKNQGRGLILVKRETASGERKGVVCALDLEHYDYNKNSDSLIRPTEGTIIERIPPRIKVREKADIETPHIMVLIDDPDKTVIEPLFEAANKKEVYNFDLMNNGGHITGFFINGEEAVKKMGESLLTIKNNFHEKYDIKNNAPLLFAMGDGNHSFATAKAWWEEVKKNGQNDPDIMDHPARWALVELVNIHDKSIIFEPIHRVIFNINPEHIIKTFKEFWEEKGSIVTINYQDNISLKFNKSDDEIHKIAFCHKDKNGIIEIKNPHKNLEAGDIQDAINHICKNNSEIKVDYIHGADHVIELAKERNNIGFILPAIKKNNFFKSIILDGTLPRKSFSMGEADDKRFYMECRKIIR